VPQLPSSITLSARRIDAVVAVFRVPLRDGAFDTPHAARVGCPLIAQETGAAARPSRAGRSSANSGRGRSVAEAIFPCGHAAAIIAIAHSGARICNQED
jgi:hypothetical protein